MTNRLPLVTTAVFATLALGACVAAPEDDLADPDEVGGKADGSASSPIGAEAQALWRSYVAELDVSKLQPGCRPFQSVLPPSVEYHGVVVLFHGFTACPQQFEEVARYLGAQGMVVLAPVLPGHGRIASIEAGSVRDEIGEVPEDGDFQAYARFALRMDAILGAARGVHVVGGISVGGAIAARVAEDGTGAERALLINSFFDAAGLSAYLLAPANALAPHVRKSWGEACELERARGRAGYCQFEITHLRAVQRFGVETAARTAAIEIPVQNLGVEADHAASPAAIASVGDRLADGATCFFESGVSHSLLSRYDSPDEDKFWLPTALSEVTRFVATGALWDTVGTSSIAGYPQCRAR